MRAIWALTILAVVAADVSHLGYHYKVPQTSYGIPSYQLGSSSNRYSGYVNSGPVYYKGSQNQYLGSTFSLGETSTPSHLSGDSHLSSSSLNGGLVSGSGLNNLYSSGSNYGYVNGLSSGSDIGYVNGLSSSLGSGLPGISSGQYYETIGGPSTALPILHGTNEYQTTHYTSGEKYQQFYQEQSNAPTQVFKHFYVHAAPEEPELPKVLPPVTLPAPQKHYKIIFIKTPQTDVHSSQILPVQPQNEEKTIVYVLQKKPEIHNEVIVPKIAPKPPSKPEVFFVKYNNKEDSEAVINNIVNDYNKDGQSVSYTTGAAALPSDINGVVPEVISYPSVTSYPGVSSYPSGSTLGSSFSNSVPSSIGSSFNAPAVLSIPSYSGSISDSSSLSSISSGSAPSFSSGSYPGLSSGSIYGLSSGSSSGSTSGSSSGLNSGSVSGLSSGSNSGFSSGSNNGFSSGSLSSTSSGSSLSSLFPSSQSESSVQAPIVSSNTQSFGSSDNSNNDASEAGSSSVLSGSAPSSTNIGFTSGEHISGSTSQGLPHETYGVPKFRID